MKNIDEDMAFWKSQSDNARSRQAALVAFGAYAALRIAKEDYVGKVYSSEGCADAMVADGHRAEQSNPEERYRDYLPACMMPDGAEPCRAFTRECEKREQVERHLRAIINHWNEFGFNNQLDELLTHANSYLASYAANHGDDKRTAK